MQWLGLTRRMIQHLVLLRFDAQRAAFSGVNPRSILIMDNASIHHIDQVQDILYNAGCLMWFLPAYSPDMNSI